ncbi:MAG: response regulator [Planctomycetota bacterium]
MMQHVYLLDDDPVELELLTRHCQGQPWLIEGFESVDALMEAADEIQPGCLLIDFRMPGKDGVEVFGMVQERALPLTCVLMTNFADIETCRHSLRAGMFDFIPKDGTPEKLLDTICRALEEQQNRCDADVETRQRRDRWDGLTEREREVATLLARGATLKQVANTLDVSVQTASKHRAKIFTKLAIKNEVDLFRLVDAIGYDLAEVPVAASQL